MCRHVDPLLYHSGMLRITQLSCTARVCCGLWVCGYEFAVCEVETREGGCGLKGAHDPCRQGGGYKLDCADSRHWRLV